MYLQRGQENLQLTLKNQHLAAGKNLLEEYETEYKPRVEQFCKEVNVDLSNTIHNMYKELRMIHDNLSKFAASDEEVKSVCLKIDSVRKEMRAKSTPHQWAVDENKSLRGLLPSQKHLIKESYREQIAQEIKRSQEEKKSKKQPKEHHDAKKQKGASYTMKQAAWRQVLTAVGKMLHIDKKLDEAIARRAQESKKYWTMEEDSDKKRKFQPTLDLTSATNSIVVEAANAPVEEATSTSMQQEHTVNELVTNHRNEILGKINSKSEELIELYKQLNDIDGDRLESEHLFMISSSILDGPAAHVSENTDLLRMAPVLEILNVAMRKKNDSIYVDEGRYSMIHPEQYKVKKNQQANGENVDADSDSDSDSENEVTENS